MRVRPFAVRMKREWIKPYKSSAEASTLSCWFSDSWLLGWSTSSMVSSAMS
jgi:hypothetical protein